MMKHPQTRSLPCAIATFLTLAVVVSVSGCGGGIDPAEEAAKKVVEDLGGTVVVEDGHIVEIDLHATKVQDSHLPSFQSLPALRVLNLQSTEVTDAVFEVAKQIKTLKELDLSVTKISPQAADKFRSAHPNMAVSGPGA